MQIVFSPWSSKVERQSGQRGDPGAGGNMRYVLDTDICIDATREFKRVPGLHLANWAV